jgi:hypothetical protein
LGRRHCGPPSDLAGARRQARGGGGRRQFGLHCLAGIVRGADGGFPWRWMEWQRVCAGGQGRLPMGGKRQAGVQEVGTLGWHKGCAMRAGLGGGRCGGLKVFAAGCVGRMKLALGAVGEAVASSGAALQVLCGNAAEGAGSHPPGLRGGGCVQAAPLLSMQQVFEKFLRGHDCSLSDKGCGKQRGGDVHYAMPP